ncbi:MAG: xanthine dehydrogenase family protein molybdopterin-binding subunit [Acidobacteriota bacterium]
MGQSLRRKEDARLVRGRGKFVDDFQMAGMLFLRFVRSPYAHARIVDVDVSSAQASPGVVCTLTGSEITERMQPFMEIGPDPGGSIVDYPLAVGKVRYQGEPVAAVVAESRMAAEDAAELVQVDYEMLPPVLDGREALKDEVVLHRSAKTNLVWHGLFDWGDVDQAFREADCIVHVDRLHFHRFSSTPLENNAVIATWDCNGKIHFLCNNSFPTFGIQFLAPALGVHLEQVQVETHDIGGSFGIKIANYPQMAVCALASRKAGGRPIKWTETRTEHLVGSGHGNERTFCDTRVALNGDGVITAIESRHIDDCGAYPRYEPLGCVIWSQVVPGVYRIRNLRIDFSQVCTNKCPCAPNRGYSRMQHLWFMERILDICGHRLGIPGDEMRLRNYIPPEEFPYTTPNGCVYDSGNYPEMLTKAKELIGWERWKEHQRQAREEGRLVGIGIGTTLDSGTNNFGQARIINPQAPFSGNSEAANIKLDMDGQIVVSLGSVPQGQGHETTTAQVVADELNVHPDMVTVRTGFNTEWNTYTGHSGTYASQFAVTGLSAVHGAAQKLKKELLRLAGFILRAGEETLEFSVGDQGPEVRARDSGQSINYWGLANLVNVNNAELPEQLREITLNCRYVYVPPFKVPDVERKYGNLTLTYAAQLHIAVLEVDRETYCPRILDYAVVDDCGRAINPMVVQGQVHGATAHGIGAALHESCEYDEGGNMITSTFSDYVPITALNMPTLRCGHIETPSPFSYNGAKGMGEGGGAPLHAVSAALQDALDARGVIINDSHNTPDSIFHALRRAEGDLADSGVRVERLS